MLLFDFYKAQTDSFKVYFYQTYQQYSKKK